MPARCRTARRSRTTAAARRAGPVRSIEKSKARGSAPGGGGAARNAAIIPHASAMPASPPITRAGRSRSAAAGAAGRGWPRAQSARRSPAAAPRPSTAADWRRSRRRSAAPPPPRRRAAAPPIASAAAGPANASSTRTIAMRGGTAPGGAVRRVRKKSAITGSSSAPACSIVAPAFSRPTPKIQLLLGLFSRSGFCSPEYLARGGRMIACIIIGT